MADVSVRPAQIGEPGVFTLQELRPGEVVRRFALERLITPESPLRPGESPDHCSLIDGRIYLVGAPDRYFDHSCDPILAPWFRRRYARELERLGAT